MLAEWSMKTKRVETDLKSRDEGKEDHGHSKQTKLNNFTVSLEKGGFLTMEAIIIPYRVFSAECVYDFTWDRTTDLLSHRGF